MMITEEQLTRLVGTAMLLALHQATRQHNRAQHSADELLGVLREVGCPDPKAVVSNAADLGQVSL